MGFIAPTPLTNPTLTYDPTPTYLLSAAADSKASFQLSPIGQPKFGIRLGMAQGDTASFFGGIDYEIPIQVVVHIVGIRLDADYWANTRNTARGGDSFAADAIFGPSSSYVGAGLDWASRIGHASGPDGPGIKLLTGAQFLPVIGYELDLIVASKGVEGAVMATFHF